MGDGCAPTTRTFFASGLKRQDNDLIEVKNAEAVVAFKRAFDARFIRDNALSLARNCFYRRDNSTTSDRSYRQFF